MTVCPSLIEHRDPRPRPVYITVRNPLDPTEYAQLRLDPPHPRSHPTWSDVCRGPRFLPSGVHLELLVAESLSNTGLSAQIERGTFHGAEAPSNGISDLAVSEGGSADRSIFADLKTFADRSMEAWKALPSEGRTRVSIRDRRPRSRWEDGE